MKEKMSASWEMYQWTFFLQVKTL